MTMTNGRFAGLIGIALVHLAACSGVAGTGDSTSVPSGGGTYNPGSAGPASGSGSGAGAGGASAAGTPVGSGSFGNVATGGGQDFAAFRQAIAQGRIPSPSSLDAAGFFAEHYTTLPAPTCGEAFCLHGMLSVSPDMARGGEWTLLQMAMNSPIDPATVAKPPLDLVVVLDRSGSMADAGKMDYAKQGLRLLVEQLGEDDTFTLIAFDNTVRTLFGPARAGAAASRDQITTIIDSIQPGGSTDIYDGLETGYKAALSVGDETQQRRVIFLTDGLPTAGVVDPARIKTMSAGYNDQYVGLTTIGLGSDVDAGLLRALSEQGGGNFYFAEKPAAVQEVFTQELAFFVAPIAYDLELSIAELPSYTVKQVYGTNLWRPVAGGGQVRIPSVFLVSRTSSMPDSTGGRRGGGSAIMAELSPTPERPAAGHCDVANLHLRYREPGSLVIHEQDAPIGYDIGDGTADGFFTSHDVEKNTVILGLYIALRDATAQAQSSPRAAHDALEAFLPKFKARIAGWADDDLINDIVILQQYIDVLAR